MKYDELAACIVFTIGVMFAMRVLPKVWRADPRYLARLERILGPWWPFGDKTWRGFRRAIPAVWVTACFMSVSAISYLLKPFFGLGVRILGTLAAVLTFVFFFLHVTVILFNRPKSIVPPSMRSEPGVMEDWLGKSEQQDR